ncbi:uncharacterized protein E5676_scaffold2376G00150 [Cucumis melo var. makuwa]|uniref:Uncharacterized protein n=1 Tax=Cucumis melo var. makuwa TaxID=1194695 RepID=A0A5D3E6B0_CUCMM|nr:uncharacterized protein E6C27_scaffold60G00920 [Cucumis melo var. makuwa]TYK31613.1 uncharacterized protein E5676_scaffold2376G00150 [Cucumis melo var. makuwa]
MAIVTEDITKLVKSTTPMKIKNTTENDDADTSDIPIQETTTEDNQVYIERLDDWDSKNHQIITWLSNISIPSIHI